MHFKNPLLPHPQYDFSDTYRLGSTMNACGMWAQVLGSSELFEPPVLEEDCGPSLKLPIENLWAFDGQLRKPSALSVFLMPKEPQGNFRGCIHCQKVPGASLLLQEFSRVRLCSESVFWSHLALHSIELYNLCSSFWMSSALSHIFTPG